MKRVLVLAVTVAGLILPAGANAGVFQGVVIAKNAKRKSIVTASANGAVRTIRAPKSFGKIGVGALVKVRATRLPDGTFAAAATTKLRQVTHTRMLGAVVKRAGQKLYLSAGNSIFVLGLRGTAGAKLRPGDRVSATVSFGKAQVFCDAVKPVGHDDELELEGIYLSNEEGVLSLAVHGKGLVKVTVPDDFDLPALNPGDEISLHATVESDGTFTLVSLDNEDADDGPGGGDGGVDMGDQEFTVTGVIGSLSATSVSVTVDGRSEPVRCSVPGSLDLLDFEVGQGVVMSCRYAGGRFVLVNLAADDSPDSGDGSVDLEGSIAALDATSVTVAAAAPPVVESANHDLKTITCALHDGEDLRGFAVGDSVEIQCDLDQKTGHHVLTELTSDNASLQYGEDGLSEWFDLQGVLQSIRSDGIGITIDGHTTPVNCAMPVGTDLSGFAVGDSVEMQCTSSGGRFNLSSLSSDSAELTLG
jgi:hypothetical protein